MDSEMGEKQDGLGVVPFESNCCRWNSVGGFMLYRGVQRSSWDDLG